VVVTQGFKPNIHDSIDFIIWDNSKTHDENKLLTYGAKLVCPIKEAVVIQEDWREKTVGMYGQEAPMGGWVDIRGYFDETRDIILHFQHNCANKVKLGDKVVEGQVVGNMGNAGQCVPIPTADYPADGTHCHFTMYLIERKQYANAIRVNPMDYFDFTKWYEGSDSEKELDYRIIGWGLNKKGFTENWQKIVYLMKRWWNGK
jgi:hypothetical protein